MNLIVSSEKLEVISLMLILQPCKSIAFIAETRQKITPGIISQPYTGGAENYCVVHYGTVPLLQVPVLRLPLGLDIILRYVGLNKAKVGNGAGLAMHLDAPVRPRC